MYLRFNRKRYSDTDADRFFHFAAAQFPRYPVFVDINERSVEVMNRAQLKLATALIAAAHAPHEDPAEARAAAHMAATSSDADSDADTALDMDEDFFMQAGFRHFDED